MNTLDEVQAAVDALLPDNDTGQISPADVRAAINLVIEAIRQGIDQ